MSGKAHCLYLITAVLFVVLSVTANPFAIHFAPNFRTKACDHVPDWGKFLVLELADPEYQVYLEQVTSVDLC